MIKAMYVFIGVAFLAALVSVLLAGQTSVPHISPTPTPDPVEVMCTADAMQCPDGGYVGRSGPDCSFVCPASATTTQHDKSDMIVLSSPKAEEIITGPLMLTGQARGLWYSEASFPVVLTNWDGSVIASTTATASDDWMTSEFVPFTATLNFVSPYKLEDPDFMKQGMLILQKDNPSGLPEHADFLEIPVRFAP